MVDITITDVTNTSDTGVFDVLMAEVNSQIENQYLASRITGSDYANVYLGSIQSVLQQSIQFILEEQMTEAQIEGIAADNLIKAQQLSIAEQELLIKEQELLIREQELALATTEANKLRDLTEAELEKQWGYEVTRDGNGDLILGADQTDGRIDKEIEKMQADIDVATEQVEIAKSQASKEYVEMLAALDKELGYDYTLDGNDDVIRSSITDAGDGRLDKEIEKITADIAIAQEQLAISKSQASKEYVEMLAGLDKELGYSYTLDVNDDVVRSSITDVGGGKLDAEVEKMQADAAIAETTLAIEQARAQASIRKEYGFDYTLDGDGNIIIGTDQSDGKLDKEIEKIQSDIDLEIEQIEIAKAQNALQKATTIVTIDKEFGFDYSLDINGYVVLGLDQQDGKIDAEITKMRADADTAKTVAATEQARAKASISKEFGFSYTVDGDGNVDVITDAGDGKLDKEIEVLQAQIDETVNSTDRANTQLDDQLLTSDQQRAILALDEQIKQYQSDNLLPAELAQTQAQTAEIQLSTVRADTQLSDQLLTADRERAVLEVDAGIREFQRDNTLPAELSVIEQKIVGKKQSAVIAE